MKWFRLFKAQFRHSLRTPWAFFFVVLAAAVSLAAGLRQSAPPADRFLVGVVNEDQGAYGGRLIENLAGFDQLVLLPMAKAEALTLLRKDKLEAVFVIQSDFTVKLKNDEYRDLIDYYTAPSSRASAAISEPLISCTVKLWIEEKAVLSTRIYLTEHDFPYTAGDESRQREMIRLVWQNDTAVRIVTETVSPGSAEAPGETAGQDVPGWLAGEVTLMTCTRWYAVFSVFYLVVSASWVLDINKRSLRVRVTQSGARLWQLLLGASLAPLLIGLFGYCLAGTLCCLLSGGSFAKMLTLILPMAVYLWTVLGLTVTLASFVRHTMALLFLAPLVTFINAILSGLITDLPDWAGFLVTLSQALPGRWLLRSFGSLPGAMPLALLCALGWFLAGVLVSELQMQVTDKSPVF